MPPRTPRPPDSEYGTWESYTGENGQQYWQFRDIYGKVWDISPNFKVLEVQPDGDSWSNSIRYEDASGNVFWDYDDEDSHHSLYYDPEGTTGLFGWLPDRWQEYGPGTDYPDVEPMDFISQGQEAPPLGEQPIGEVLGGPPKTYVPPGDDPSDKTLSDFRTQPTYNPPADPMYTLPDPPDRLPPEPEPPPPAQGGPQNPPAGGDGGGGGIAGIRVPYLDSIPFFPVGQDPATGEWRYEQAHDPELARKWAEERGIEPPPPSEQAQGGPQDPPPGGGDEGGIPGLGVPYRDFIPTYPMVKDPTTGQWRNAEPGEIAGAEGGKAGQTQDPNAPPPEYGSQEVSPLQFGNTGNFQNAPAEPTAVEQSPAAEQPVQPAPPPPPEQPPVAEQQPAPAPPPPYDPAADMPQPDGDGDGIPNEYGDGPDLDGNGIPDEVGINPDSLQPGYPDPSASVDWGGVAVPDPTVVPQSNTTTAGAEAMPEEGYGEGSDLGGNWVPEEAGIDPYALQQPAYPDSSSSSTSGDEAWDPYDGSSDPYGSAPPEEALPVEEAPVAEGEDSSASGSF